MSDETPEIAQKRPFVNAPTSKVTIAFPFSAIKMDEPSQELKELSAIVCALAEQIAALQPSPETDELAQKAQALVTKLQ